MKRDFSRPPLISDVPTYAEGMKTWWANMKIPGSKAQSSSSLQHLRKGGPNGIVMLCLHCDGGD